MKKMAVSNVLIVGLKGLGAEIGTRLLAFVFPLSVDNRSSS